MTIGLSNEPPPPTSRRSSSDRHTAAQTNSSASSITSSQSGRKWPPGGPFAYPRAHQSESRGACELDLAHRQKQGACPAGIHGKRQGDGAALPALAFDQMRAPGSRARRARLGRRARAKVKTAASRRGCRVIARRAREHCSRLAIPSMLRRESSRDRLRCQRDRSRERPAVAPTVATRPRSGLCKEAPSEAAGRTEPSHRAARMRSRSPPPTKATRPDSVCVSVKSSTMPRSSCSRVTSGIALR
jgi:hypothetical protein